jgi:hypothetical protein
LIEKYQRQLEEDGGTGLLEGSSGTDPLKPGTDWICLDHGVHGSPGGGKCSVLLFGHPG